MTRLALCSKIYEMVYQYRSAARYASAAESERISGLQLGSLPQIAQGTREKRETPST